MIRLWSRNKSGCLDPVEVVRDPETELEKDGRDLLMFLLSNEVMWERVTADQAPSEAGLTQALWVKFCEETDIPRLCCTNRLRGFMLCIHRDSWCP